MIMNGTTSSGRAGFLIGKMLQFTASGMHSNRPEFDRADGLFAGFSPPQDLDDRLQQLAVASEPNVPPSFDP